MRASRVTVFAGHFGSGKTTLAVNYALWLKETHGRVALCDLDIVNPYFRTADAAQLLQQAGVRLISSRFANTNVDAPAVPAEAKAMFDDAGLTSVVDLGGDDRGALALGRYAGFLAAGAEVLLTVNRYRPLTSTVPELAEMKAEIEAAAGVAFTGLAHNSNLGAQTTPGDILAALPFARDAAQSLGLPVKMTAVSRAALRAAGAEDLARIAGEGEIFPVEVFKKPIWDI